jgi:hypothetical protein
MKVFQKYDPEDIESLLLHKEFGDLYESEKTFVLKHISSEEEYAGMREQLLQIQQLMAENDDRDFFKPDPRRREKLIAYMKESKPERVLWLNSMLAVFHDGQRFRAPAFQLAAVILFMITGVILYTSIYRDNPGTIVQVESTAPIATVPETDEKEIVAAPGQNENKGTSATGIPPQVKDNNLREDAATSSENAISNDNREQEDIAGTTKDNATAGNNLVTDNQLTKKSDARTDSLGLKQIESPTYAIENNVSNDYNNQLNTRLPMNTYNVTNRDLAVKKENIKYRNPLSGKTGKQKLSRSLADIESLQALLVEAF